MNIILLMLCLATAIYACYEAYKKMRESFTEGRLFMLLAMVGYALVYLVALVVRIPGNVDRLAERQTIRGILGMGYDPSVIYAAEAAVVLLTVLMYQNTMVSSNGMRWLRIRKSGSCISEPR